MLSVTAFKTADGSFGVPNACGAPIVSPPTLFPDVSHFRSLRAHVPCRLSAAHTPDNSFLGFVVEQHLNASDIKHIDDIKRQNQSLVYGKVDNFWKVR